MNYVSIDIGASSGKVSLVQYNSKRITLDTLHVFEHSPCQIRDALVWDLPLIVENVRHGLRKAVIETGDRLFSVGFDSFSNDFALISPNGDIITHVRCYRDARTVRNEQSIYARITKKRLYELSGNQIAPFNTFMQLAAMAEEGQAYLFGQGNQLLFLPDLLAYIITGIRVSEYTVASVSQMYSYAERDWCDEILKTYGIPRMLFAPIIQPGKLIGRASREYCDAVGSTNGFSVSSVCAHDTASAFLAGGNGADDIIISSGTWALVGMQAEQPTINEFGFSMNIANEGGPPNRHRLLKNVMGNWLLQQIKREYHEQDRVYSFSDLIAMAEREAPFASLIDVDDARFFEPGNMLGKIRAYCVERSQKPPETPGQFVRCVCESLAIKYKAAVEALERLSGRRFQTINIIGGGSKDAFTSQLTANACKRRVICGPEDATSIGNVLMQILASGELRALDEAREITLNSFARKEYLPRDCDAWEAASVRF